ncbi:DUF6641 family protein [Methylorubrum extorquens]|uniref:Uncharacterized protein n=1 Tax=Methylorubrum extorquens DSM 13060 TaxID=882800 RepID=H1KQZ5_METEX|nr:DUF6641 family protein [Methylorubrum extorquens]EHP90054.1 hypothetical protein MetexDRAFT_5058 [Methylorubrum extorquens DSM 13060]
MSVLKTLKLSAAAPATPANDPVSRAREKLLGQLAEQKNMVDATLEGRLYEPPKVPAIRKDASGQRMRVEVGRRVRKGWFQDQAGTVHFIIRVGGKPLELQPGKAAISVGNLDKLPNILDALITAVRAGELDPKIKEAAAARGLMMAERRKKAV